MNKKSKKIEKKSVKAPSKSNEFKSLENILYPKSKMLLLLIDVVIAVFLIIISTSNYSEFKVNMMKQNPGYSDGKDNAMFWSETAYQYRYAKMFADGDPQIWSTLSNDVKLQYPDGVDAWKDYTTFMEPVHGWFYQWFISKDVPFHIYLMWFVAVFSSLLTLIIYFSVRAIWKSPIYGLLASLAWMLVPASFFRQVSNIYLKEDFSIIFIILFIVFFIISLNKKKIVYPILGAVSLFIALISWHFSQFMFLLLAGSFFLVYTFSKDINEHWIKSLTIYSIAGLVAGLVPVLWNRTFIFSQPMLICYTILLMHYGKKYWAAKFNDKIAVKVLLSFGVLIVLNASNFIFNTHIKEYSHVFSLFWYKLMYLGQAPANPSEIPYDARVFWTGNFEGLTTNEIYENFRSLWWLLILIPIFFLISLFNQNKKKEKILLFIVFIGSLLASFMIGRLVIFLAVLTAIAMPFIPYTLSNINEIFTKGKTKNSSGGKSLTALIALASCLIIVYMCYSNYEVYKVIKPEIKEDVTDKLAVFNWVKENTPQNAAFLTQISDGPMILLYTDRPVILNSQFENNYIRRRAEEFGNAFFGTEQQLFDLCKKYKADYLLMNSNMVLPANIGSNRYNACKTEPLNLNTAAAMLQFEPEKMQYFAPVYDNTNYRIVKVLRNNELKDTIWWERGYSPNFNEKNFTISNNKIIEPDSTLSRIRQASNIVQENGQYFYAIMQIIQKKGGKSPQDKMQLQNLLQVARSNMQRAIALSPNDFSIYNNFAVLEAQTGNKAGAIQYLDKALELAPNEKDLLSFAFEVLSQFKEWEKIESIFTEKVQTQPNNISFYYYIAKAQKELNKQELSIENTKKVLELKKASDNPRIIQSAEKLLKELKVD